MKILPASLELHISQIIVPVKSRDFFQELYAAHRQQSLSRVLVSDLLNDIKAMTEKELQKK